MKTVRRLWQGVLTLLWMALLPLAGLVVYMQLTASGNARQGVDLRAYFEFPPMTQYVEHAPFSMTVFIGMALGIAVFVVPFVWCVLTSQRHLRPVEPLRHRAFAWWGWLGLALSGVTWWLAWSRFDWFESAQLFTFSPLWLGYILVVNAWTLKRSGRCVLTDRPGYLLGLFLLSAAFWWFFEYLNRFVQNWYYVGIDDLTPWQYFLFATLPFATVLPAVLGTCELLETSPRLSAGLNTGFPLQIPYPRVVAAGALGVAMVGLGALGAYPDYLYPLLWLSPLIVITALQTMRGNRTVLSEVGEGRWARIWLLALAALICGFFWEMWNMGSLAKWRYSVPFVGRFHLFEMPLLGYAGYLPFGLECAVVAELVFGRRSLRDDGERDDGSLIPPCRPAPPIRCMMFVNAAVLAFVGIYFFVAPGFLTVRNLADPALSGPEIPRMAWRLHRDMVPRYTRWARARIKSGKAGDLYLYDVPSTEWPIFGSVYYLWATENLQRAWERDPSPSKEAPKVYARKALDACIDVVLDPVHHTWVKTHWGEDYMHNQNVFFRSLVIAGITSYTQLTGDRRHVPLLIDQIDTLSAELDASPRGVLEDYPGECYPIDVLAAWACIKRADELLGTDHSALIERGKRGFQGDMLDKRGLPPYFVDALTGKPTADYQPSRGVGNSYVLIFLRDLWPELADEWYARYETHFWQDKGWVAGFREFPNDVPGYNWTYDVDAGPIIDGFSPAANAFGVAGAKVNGRLDHAFTLGSQVLMSCWPLPNGSLFGPRIFSSQGHAPYLGEACILFFLSHVPSVGVPIVSGGGHRVGQMVVGFTFLFGTGLLLLWLAWRRCLPALHGWPRVEPSWLGLQFLCWLGLLFLALVFFAAKLTLFGVLALMAALGLPARRIV